MIYKVIKYFTDAHDNSHPYSVGDIFPRAGVKVTEERIAILAGYDNRHGVPLIVPVKVQKAKKKAEEPAEK